MARLETLRRQVEAAEDLRSIVGAMKSISSGRIRRFRGAVEALDAYGETVERAFQVALHGRPGLELPEPAADAPRVSIVFGTDQGLAGDFNARVVTHAHHHGALSGGGGAHLFAVGERVAEALEGRGAAVAERFPVPGSVGGVGRIVQDLLLACERWRVEEGVERFTLFYNGTGDHAASYEPRRVGLLPLDSDWLEALRSRPWEGPTLPDHRPDTAALFRHLVREALFMGLFRALAVSVASENASRLAAMTAAEGRIEDRLKELSGRYHRLRQQEITQELLEIVSGFQVLEEEAESGPGGGEDRPPPARPAPRPRER